MIRLAAVALVLIVAIGERGVDAGKLVVAGTRFAADFSYPWNPQVDYNAWASNHTLSSTDAVVFEYSQQEAVYSLPSFDDLTACNFSRASLVCSPEKGTDRACVVPVTPAPRYLTSVEEHCQQGQQVVIQAASLATATTFARRKRVFPHLPEGLPIDFAVGGSSGLGAPPLFVPQASGSGSGSGGGGKTIVVGLPKGDFTYPFNPAVDYIAWAANTKIYRGDVITFKYPMYQQEVVRFTSLNAYKTCNYNSATIVCYDVWGAFAKGCTIKVDNQTAYYGSGLYSHCRAGMKFTVRPKAVPYVPRKLVVGEPLAQYNPAGSSFTYPWNPRSDMAAWTAATKIYKGDRLVFKYPRNANTVYQVPTLADYRTCNYKSYIASCGAEDGVGVGCETNPITTTSYFIASTYGNCMRGQRVIAKPLPPPS
ncbi:hypothetical protein CLOM_g15190 [Closterium sp. NIES-68]|nr:hypothetical protein CLOM_g15190 [Closterium sp. NIES-68]GJP80184.1 hypothetical protein CLOP_g10403 [Closterium sp. NIES-67]